MDVLMPQLGETVAEGKITKWFKSAGDAVKPGDNLFEIETDKVSMEVPSTVAGTLIDIRFNVGEVAKVGAVIAVIVGAGETMAPSTPARSERAGASLASARRRESGDPGFRTARAPARVAMGGRVSRWTHSSRCARPSATTARRKLRAASRSRRWRDGSPPSRGIDLSRITGSGPHGRVVARDIESAPRPAAPRAALAEGPTADQVKALYAPDSYEEVPLDGMRRTIAARLTQATQTIPHFYLTADIEIDRLLALREEANAAASQTAQGWEAGVQALRQ